MISRRFHLTPETPWGSAWHADSLFGAICWGIRELRSVSYLEEFLQEALAGNPGLVLSNAFPAGLMPFPLSATQKLTTRKLKPVWTTEENFLQHCQGSAREIEAAPNPFAVAPLLHTSVGRESGLSSDGELFEIDQTVFLPSAPSGELVIFVRATPECLSLFRASLRLMEAGGFGRKSSTGMGAFRLSGEKDCPWLDRASGSNGFVALSHFVPAPSDPVDGRWGTQVADPKFQGNRVQHFLKGRILRLTPGSTFHTTEEPKPYYGRALPMAREGMPRALHYAFALAAPVKLASEE